ncbi:MAG: hypothetical protein JSS20_03620 [Proteobacteria bacterium]|nr:hypothetical protein [Pseudomonadota bacterium]
MSSTVRAIALKPGYDLGQGIELPGLAGIERFAEALKDRIVRFAEKLPEHRSEVDVEALVKFPVP